MAYPKKMISPDGAAVFAKQEVHEAELAAQGYTPAPEEPKKPVLGQTQATGGEPCAKCVELQAEVDQLKAALAEATAPKALEDMRAGELLQYAKDKGLDIGDMKPQQGAVNILAAIRAVEAKA